VIRQPLHLVRYFAAEIDELHLDIPCGLKMRGNRGPITVRTGWLPPASNIQATFFKGKFTTLVRIVAAVSNFFLG
jgi:hypothetical protein